MERAAFFGITFSLLSFTSIFAQGPETSKPEPEHQFLKKFEGTWDCKNEAIMGPGQAPTQCTATMTSRMLGDLWVVTDIKGDMGGANMHGLMTIGYDPAKKKYVGTWVDNMMNHLWKYEGTVDATGKILTLEAEGPNMAAPDQTTKYRDVYEFTSDDQVTTKSSMLLNGEWVVFVNGKGTRKK